MAERPSETLSDSMQNDPVSSHSFPNETTQSIAHRQWPMGFSASGSPDQPDNNQENADGLERTIEGEVIPRLMLALRGAVPGLGAAKHAIPLVPTSEHIAELTELSMAAESAALRRMIDQLQAQGMTLDALYLNLLAPAARRLGELWEEDAVDFNDVTIGLGQIHAIVRTTSGRLRGGGPDAETACSNTGPRRAVLAPAHGEQHTLGCALLEHYFSRAGWDVTGWPISSDTDLVTRVRTDYLHVVGLSVSCGFRLAALEHQVQAIRRASRNRSLIIMVGGGVFLRDPQLARTVGADLTAATAQDAVAAANAAMTPAFESV